MILGIDASNLLQGGGRTHLAELLSAAVPREEVFGRVVVWGRRSTLDALPDQPWITKICPSLLEKGYIERALWQRFRLAKEAEGEGCDVLFSPGGTVLTKFRPVVTMSQNMLPFEWGELSRYGFSIKTLRLLLLRVLQTRAFRRADGVIFLTEWAHRRVTQVTGPLRQRVATIPHGVNARFLAASRLERVAELSAGQSGVRLLYVSTVDQYKHQWNVVEAVAALRQKHGWDLSLDMIGPAFPPALRRLKTQIAKFDADGAWARYLGVVPYGSLDEIYRRADIGVFASSCENMPNILIEMMAAALPIACSNRGPMPEVLRDAGVYFDPEKISSIAEALERLVTSPDLRSRLADAAYRAASVYSWEGSVNRTFEFLADVARQHRASETLRFA